MTALDSKQYKEEERKSWDSVANNWQKWWKTIEIGAEKVRLADIRPGSRVLDVATGIGEPSITAANLVMYWPQVFRHRCYICKAESYLIRFTRGD